MKTDRTMKYLMLLIIPFLLFSCSSYENASVNNDTITPVKQRPLAYKSGKFFDENGSQMLYGGDSTQHFDVSNSSLEDEQFHYGIGREAFPALLKPEFTTIAAVDSIWHDSTRFLVAYSGNDIKAYSVKDLTRHEVVNDVLNGEPIMAAYCILADLGAIYSRKYGESTLTFALSGYTYFDPETWDGLDGFVLWDRETESLWWPLINQSFAGKLKGVNLQEMSREHWEDTTWKKLKKDYPSAKILISGQDYERPNSWELIDRPAVKSILSNFSE